MAELSNRDWSGVDQGAYADNEEYCAACLIDLNGRRRKTRAKCLLPIREPQMLGGRLNSSALRLAMAKLTSNALDVADATVAQREKALRQLRTIYDEMNLPVPRAAERSP